MNKSDFPYIQLVDGAITFRDGDIVLLPKEYLKPSSELVAFYSQVLKSDSSSVRQGTDPIGFNYVFFENLCNIGILIGAGAGAKRNLVKRYPQSCFSKEFLMKRIEKERKLMSFEDFIPREFVQQNIHELRNLNSKISSNIDELLNVREEEEWDEKFDKADDNVKKIFVASRLIKFILDNIKFYIPEYINGIQLDISRSFRVHRSVSKIVKINSNDFKKKKVKISMTGSTNKILAGDRELFEIILMLLVENAIKYSNDPVTLPPQVDVVDRENRTEVAVRSYGRIVPSEDQDRLFSKGFRSVVHKGVGEGTGMGLHNAAALVNLFGGKIAYSAEQVSTVERLNVGWNCFKITL